MIAKRHTLINCFPYASSQTRPSGLQRAEFGTGFRYGPETSKLRKRPGPDTPSRGSE